MTHHVVAVAVIAACRDFQPNSLLSMPTGALPPGPMPIPCANNQQAVIVTMTKYSSKKTARDPNAPKRSLSSYLLYQNAMRSTFKQQNPNMTFGELAKFTSANYAAMSPEEKALWVEKALADKERYHNELAMYTPPPGYDSKGDALDYSGKKNNKRRASKAARDKNAPKRNLSPYLLYQNAMRFTFKKLNPNFTFGELSKYTSQMYNAMTPEEKALWVQKAEDDKKRYELELNAYTPPPGYDAYGVQLATTIDGTEFSTSKKAKKRGSRAEVVHFAVPGVVDSSSYAMIPSSELQSHTHV